MESNKKLVTVSQLVNATGRFKIYTDKKAAGSGGGSPGANGADLPTHPASISAHSGNHFATVLLEYSNTDYIDGVQVNYKTDGIPESPIDGELVTVEAPQTEIKITGLTNAQTYYLRVFLYHDVDGVRYYQTDRTNAIVEAIPRAVEVIGLVPYAEGPNFLVFTESGTGYISAPIGTEIIVATAGESVPSKSSDTNNQIGGKGGYVNKYILDTDLDNRPFELTIGAKRTILSTKFSITDVDNLTYAASTYVSAGIDTEWGPIGGDGGNGATYDEETYDDIDRIDTITTKAADGKGAGGAGGGAHIDLVSSYSSYGIGGKGGNEDHSDTQNFGGSGGGRTSKTTVVKASDGASGTAGASSGDSAGGGGGGFGSGGGGGGVQAENFGQMTEYIFGIGRRGNPGLGIMVVQWPLVD